MKVNKKLYSFKTIVSFSILVILLILGKVNNVKSQQLYINEFLASNITANPEIVDFDDYSDWLEIYNAENDSVDLGGYYLTDNLNDTTKWQIPAGTFIASKGFIRFWADGEDDVPGNLYQRSYLPFYNFVTTWFHLNFKLSKAGEEIGLYSPQKVLIDSVTYGFQIPDVSYGRKPESGSEWFYFGEPTPGSENSTTGILSTAVATAAYASLKNGFYDGSQTIMLSTDSPTATIRYTTDGSKPVSASNEYIYPINIDSTTVLRTRVYDINKLPGPIITQTYFIDEGSKLPIVSIAAFPETLFGGEFGIYENGYKDREIPVSIEFYEPDGILGFQYDAGFRISGQASFDLYPQKPFTIYMRDRFGDEEISYQIFTERNINKFRAIYFRNSGVPDNNHTKESELNNLVMCYNLLTKLTISSNSCNLLSFSKLY